MQKNIGRALENAIYIALGCVVILFFGAIIWTNLNASQWFNFDIYTDSIIAKYMWEDRSLFPEGWTFGNQLYVVATPVLSALFYGITSDSVLSLGLASCVMTLLTVGSFLWCMYPFVQKRELLVGLFCLIGGTLLSESAASDWEGMQIFYTMASYYACYVIGIFFTMGIWLRIFFEKRVHWILPVIAFLLNAALGMQSLREILVLNLPLCALSFCLTLAAHKDKTARKRVWRSNLFAVTMLAAGIAGLVLITVMKDKVPIRQVDILSKVGTNFGDNIINSAAAFFQYADLSLPSQSRSSMVRFFSVVIIVCVVLYAIVCSIKKGCITPGACMICFCVISLAAVFFAGVFVILLRVIYYFVWHLLVAIAVMHTAESLQEHRRKKLCLLVSVLLIGSASFLFQFRNDICNFSSREAFYEEISETLVSDDIAYVYYDAMGMDQASRVAAFADDKITYCAVTLQPALTEGETGNIFSHIMYLCHDDWFQEENQENAYLMVSGETLTGELWNQHRSALLPHITLVHQFTYGNEEHYFFKVDDVIFQDLISD